LKIWRNLLGKIEFHYFLAFITILAFCWPFFITPNLTNNTFVFYFLYGSWFAVIVLHFLMDRFTTEAKDEDDK